MGEAVYTPGPALAALAGRTLVVWTPRSDIDPTRMWHAVTTGGVPELLEALCGDLSLSRLPSFAVALREPGAVRVLVRGELRVRVGSPATTVDARGASTWVETVVPLPDASAGGAGDLVEVGADGEASGGGEAPLPLLGGVVAASRVAWFAGASVSGPVADGGGAARVAVNPVEPSPMTPVMTPAAPAPAPVPIPAPAPTSPAEDTLTDVPGFDALADTPDEAGPAGTPAPQGRDVAAEASISYEYLHGARGGRSVAAARSLDDGVTQVPDESSDTLAEAPDGAGGGGEPDGDAAGEVTAVPDAAPPTPAAPPAPPVVPAAPAPTPAFAPPSPPSPPVATPAATASAPTAPPSGGGLITGSPWALRSPGAPAQPPAPASSSPAPPPSAPAFPTPAPPFPVAPPDPATSGSDGRLGDHDDLTIARTDATFRREPARRAPSGPEVLAVRCAAGHLNSPASATCRVCGGEVPDAEPVPVPRPDLGVLRFSTGRDVVLDRPVIVGRAPRAQGQVGEVPQLVSVASPEQEISSSHLEIRIEGWQVLAVDLESLNGTVVTLPGRAPVRLRPHAPTLVVPGTTIDLPDDVVITFEATS